VSAGVAGSVRNCADGTVEAVFEGDPAVVDSLVAWCHYGPALAQVTAVDVGEERPVGARTFVVR
jgi:acylphosphatase